MDNKQKKEIEKQIEAMAQEGLRILGVAKARFTGDKLPTSQKHLVYEFI
jgi:Ca2+-transporting ATPase